MNAKTVDTYINICMNVPNILDTDIIDSLLDIIFLSNNTGVPDAKDREKKAEMEATQRGNTRKD